MTYYLAKTEPNEYSIDDLAKDGTASWDGVTNPTAVKFLKSMQPDDKVLIYHSGGESQIVGLAEVVSNSRPDPDEPKSWLVDFKFIKKFDNTVSLREIKQSELFDDTKLVRQGRLSTMDLPDHFIEWLKKEKGLSL
jgi:predicted RNA-binding protein with PUA-like domain